jgi:hypothetical protein
VCTHKGYRQYGKAVGEGSHLQVKALALPLECDGANA